MEIILNYGQGKSFILCDDRENILSIIEAEELQNVHDKLSIAIKNHTFCDIVDIIKIVTQDKCVFKMLVHIEINGMCNLKKFIITKKDQY